MTNTQYKCTGNSHPVNKNQLLQSVFDAIDEFENDPDNQNILNPYEESVIVKLNNGKIIQVPSEIQNEAIEKWVESNNNNIYVAKNGNPSDDILDHPIHINKKPQIIVNPNNYVSESGSLKYILLVIAITITIYAFSKK